MKKTLINKETGELIKTSVINSVTIDCVIFGFQNGNLEILLVKHAMGIRKGEWGLPGGWIREMEGIDEAATRLLHELTGLQNIFLEQLRAFGSPNRFPTERIITLGYFSLINKEKYDVKAGYTASEAVWFKIDQIPNLIYDHSEILQFSLTHLRQRVRKAPIGFNLLPEKFTLLQLMRLYEEILGIEMDKPNFRRKFLRMRLLIDLKEKQKDVSHRAAKLYSFDDNVYKNLTEKGFNFEF